MTVINCFDDARGSRLCGRNETEMKALQKGLKKVFAHFDQSFVPVPPAGISKDESPEYNVSMINCNTRQGALSVSATLKSVVAYLKEQPKNMYPAARLIQEDIMSGQWDLVMSHLDWMKKASEVLEKFYADIKNLPEKNRECVLNVIARKSLEALIHTGAILELSGGEQMEETSESSEEFPFEIIYVNKFERCDQKSELSDVQYITSPNLFTNKLLGAVLEGFKDQRNLTYQDLVAQARKRSQEFNEIMLEYGIKNLSASDILKSIDLAIPVESLQSDDATNASMIDDEYFYVIVGLLEVGMPQEASAPLPNVSRKLIRTFRLANTVTGMFYPVFYARFFRDVIVLENGCDNQVWRNGLNVRMSKLLSDGDKRNKFSLQINISPDGESEDGFRVMVATDERSLWSRDYALEVMEKIWCLLFEKYCHLELVEYCGDKTADEMQWLVMAHENTEDLQYHTKYWGEYPDVDLVDRIVVQVNRLMVEHTRHLIEQYKCGITILVEKQNDSRAVLERQIRGLGKALRNISNKNVSRLSKAVKVMLENQSKENLMKFDKLLNKKMKVLLDEIESAHIDHSIVEMVEKLKKHLDWLSSCPDTPQLVENILTPWLEKVRCYFGTAKSSTIDCKLAIDTMIIELKKNIASVSSDTLLPLSEAVVRFAAEIRHMRTFCDQMPPGTKRPWNLLLKMNSRFQRIHEALKQGQPIEEVKILLINVFVLQLSDELSVIRQSLHEPILEDCENQSTQAILDTMKTDLSRICKMVYFAKSVGISMLTGLICGQSASPNDLVKEQLRGYMQTNDARYAAIHSLLMEQAHNIRAIRTMQENVLYSAHDMPLLWGVSAKKDKWFGTKYHLQCICCVCGRMVRGGSTEEEKQNKGYLKLFVKYEWVKDALKVLKVTLQVLEIVSRIAGVPFPAFSTFIDVMNDEAMSQELIQRVSTAVETIRPTVNQTVATAKELAEEAQKFVLRGGNDDLNEQTMNIVQQRVTEISLLYVKNIRNLLTALNVSFPPQHCGLQPVKHPEEGNIVWLCQESSAASPNACRDKFLREGRNGLLYYPSFV